jgi:hypothetical protein
VGAGDAEGTRTAAWAPKDWLRLKPDTAGPSNGLVVRLLLAIMNDFSERIIPTCSLGKFSDYTVIGS